MQIQSALQVHCNTAIGNNECHYPGIPVLNHGLVITILYISLVDAIGDRKRNQPKISARDTCIVNSSQKEFNEQSEQLN